jgi:ATP adenylyltransferase
LKVLWAPWRLSYVGAASDAREGCIFCDKPQAETVADRRDALLLWSNERVSVIMNLYPYTNAHLLVSPRNHTCDFARMDAGLQAELQTVVARSVRILERVYAPAGFNLGMNLGSPAGAGIADHLHWHIVPRWEGDTNFMTVVGDTRVMPEHIQDTYDRLLPLFEEAE